MHIGEGRRLFVDSQMGPCLDSFFQLCEERDELSLRLLCDIMISHEEGFTMSQLIVRNLEDDVKTRLRQRASRHGRSVEEEVRDILRNATKEEGQRKSGVGSAMSHLFQNLGLRQDIPELKGRTPQSPAFDT